MPAKLCSTVVVAHYLALGAVKLVAAAFGLDGRRDVLSSIRAEIPTSPSI